ncbi:hypothetical protein chiPu_0028663 [Chiloscyllium punctatum]|uniref:Uncharacterized protein n=1 Tax=Chiloscyllium punctatum TaxID=137246 RepID=A0A401TP35_CHIPU|nr:hypothetical protein [Chiloscyllium punctatum]
MESCLPHLVLFLAISEFPTLTSLSLEAIPRVTFLRGECVTPPPPRIQTPPNPSLPPARPNSLGEGRRCCDVPAPTSASRFLSAGSEQEPYKSRLLTTVWG